MVASVSEIKDDWNARMFPLLLSAGGIVSGIVTLLVCDAVFPVAKNAALEKALKGVLVISTILETPFIYGTAVWALPSELKIGGLEATPLTAWWPIWLGLWSGLIIGYTTEYYTSHSYSPVRSIAN